MITITDGNPTGTLTIAAGNAEDVYLDATDLENTITAATGGNFENLVIGDATATAVVNDTIDTTVVTLGDVTVNGAGTGTISASVDYAVTETDLVITLSNGATVTIAVGETTGTSTDFEVLGDATVGITGTTGGNYEFLDITDTQTYIEGPGVRTPGFWQSPNGLTYWDGIDGNEAKGTEPGDNFPDKDLAHYDSDDSEFYLLLGDMDGDGDKDPNETTIRINYDDAIKIISSKNKNKEGAGKEFDLARHAIATQLNKDAGNNVGDGSEGTPAYYLDQAVKWLLGVWDDNSDCVLDGLDENSTPMLKGKDMVWQDSTANAIAGKDILSSLDEYNNDGKIDGKFYAPDADAEDYNSEAIQNYLATESNYSGFELSSSDDEDELFGN